MTRQLFRVILCATVGAMLTALSSVPAKADDFGTVNVNTFNSSGNSCVACCFPSSQGWSKYNYVTNFYFVGPYGTNTSVGGVPCMANTNHRTNLVISTCATFNGTTLQTGIKILNLYIPGTSCQTNNCGNLTTNMIIMSSSAKQAVYKAQVFYKGASLGTNVFIQVDWSYTNP